MGCKSPFNLMQFLDRDIDLGVKRVWKWIWKWIKLLKYRSSINKILVFFFEKFVTLLVFFFIIKKRNKINNFQILN
jgi:hypothetical protein